MIIVESDEAAILHGELELSQVEAILRPFRFASLVAGSQVSKTEAVQIAEDSKVDWWARSQNLET